MKSGNQIAAGVSADISNFAAGIPQVSAAADETFDRVCARGARAAFADLAALAPGGVLLSGTEKQAPP